MHLFTFIKGKILDVLQNYGKHPGLNFIEPVTERCTLGPTASISDHCSMQAIGIDSKLKRCFRTW